MAFKQILLVAATAILAQEVLSCSIANRLGSWNGGGKDKMETATGTQGGWTLVITFDKTLTNFENWTYNVKSRSGNKVTLTGNGGWIGFEYVFSNNGASATVTSAKVNGVEKCSGGGSSPSPSPSPSPSGPSAARSGDAGYNYKDSLKKSIIFYEAQRSGKLPADNRVPWRGDSALGDLIQGGWYDAGDFVKFGFPMAGSCTQLMWGAITYKGGYEKAGQLANVKDSLNWVTDYLVKAHTSKYELVGQIGNGDIDHAYWGRPEDMTMQRPAYKITASKPGSDLAGETAACLAAASIFYKSSGQASRGSTALTHAKDLFDFADQKRGKYSDSIPDAAKFYKSWSGYGDELCWSAMWLYKATNQNSYLNKAKSFYNTFGLGNDIPDRFDWDNKKAGCYALLFEATGETKYKNALNSFINKILNGKTTPKGLRFIDAWGSLRHAANVAQLFFQVADMGHRSSELNKFAEKQINYMLGDGGRSFQIGFGSDFPKRPHHRSSSCKPKPAQCGYGVGSHNTNDPNPHTLVGALVGGPDEYDNFVDDRTKYEATEVTTDYNAAFQGAVARMVKEYE